MITPDQLTAINYPPRISSAQPSNGIVGQPYSHRLMSVAGRVINWSLVSGVLPNGLTLNQTTGLISGTPTATNPGTPFVVEALNNAGVEYEMLSVAVDAACTLPSPTQIPEAYGRVGVWFQAQLGGTGSGPFTWSLSAGAWPPGVTLDPATGVLSGRPTVAGSYPVTIRAQNACGSGNWSGTILIGQQRTFSL